MVMYIMYHIQLGLSLCFVLLLFLSYPIIRLCWHRFRITVATGCYDFDDWIDCSWLVQTCPTCTRFVGASTSAYLATT
jgi:hypothetical protein